MVASISHQQTKPEAKTKVLTNFLKRFQRLLPSLVLRPWGYEASRSTQILT